MREPRDFSDPDSVEVLDAATRVLAREMGRQCARELWKETQSR